MARALPELSSLVSKTCKNARFMTWIYNVYNVIKHRVKCSAHERDKQKLFNSNEKKHNDREKQRGWERQQREKYQ